MDPKEKITIGLVGGVLGGFALGYVIFNHNHSTDRVILHQGDKHSVARTVEGCRPDAVYVKAPSGTEDWEKGEYVLFGTFLESIPDRHDRAIKKAEIEKLVEW